MICAFGVLCAALLGGVPSDTVPADGGKEVAAKEPQATLDLGGALRFNYHYKEWRRGNPDINVRELGEFEFDTFRLNADGTYGDLLLSAEYRIYAGYHMLHHGWVGYRFSDALTAQVGVHKVPFGAQPYASHNWFFQLPYYVGLEDDYDAGLKTLWSRGPWDVQLAFYSNSEGSYTGNSLASARYSYDVVPVRVDELAYAGLEEDRFNREVNQFNARIAHQVEHAEGRTTELGLSGQWGQLYNSATDSYGTQWAAVAHLDATWERWNLKAEAIRYEMSPRNPAGVDSRFVVMGAYDAPYKVASAADLYLAGLAYTLPVSWGPIGSLQFYNDYTYMRKSEAGYADTQQNVLGTAISAGPLYVYVDLASGKNHPWLGPGYGSALAEGGTRGDWSTRFNVNIGYYF